MVFAHAWRPAVAATSFARGAPRDAPNSAPDRWTPALPPARFLRFQRLCRESQFGRVFRHPIRVKGYAFIVMAAPQAPRRRARLGLAVARRNARLAVQRVRLKRIVRESFRRHQDRLYGLDLVVMTRPSAVSLEAAKLRAELTQHWETLVCEAGRARTSQAISG